jgi:hypothetical protein
VVRALHDISFGHPESESSLNYGCVRSPVLLRRGRLPRCIAREWRGDPLAQERISILLEPAVS